MANGTLKVSNIQTSSGSGTITLGQSGETITIPSGCTITNSGTQTGFGGANTPAFLLKQTSATSLVNNTRTKVNIDSAEIDTASGLDTTNKRWVVPSGQAGKYFIYYSLRIESGDDFNNCNAIIYKNGSALVSVWGRNEFYHTFTGSFTADLSVSDYLELYGLQGSGGNLNASTSDFGLQTFFGGYKIIE
jgi:hypothetical protein